MKQRQLIAPRQRILQAADQLFYRVGIRATGTDKIMEVADVAKATFYKEFESKDALVLAYLDLREEAFWSAILTPVPPSDIYEAITRIDQFSNQPGVVGCPFTLVAAEYRVASHPFHDRVVKHKDKILALLTELLEPCDQSAAIAAQLLMIVDGALAMRAIYGSSEEALLMAAATAIIRAGTRPG